MNCSAVFPVFSTVARSVGVSQRSLAVLESGMSRVAYSLILHPMFPAFATHSGTATFTEGMASFTHVATFSNPFSAVWAIFGAYLTQSPDVAIFNPAPMSLSLSCCTAGSAAKASVPCCASDPIFHFTDSGKTLAASSLACPMIPDTGASAVLTQLERVLAMAEEGDNSPLTPFATLLPIPLAHSENASHVFSAAHASVPPSHSALFLNAVPNSLAIPGFSGS